MELQKDLVSDCCGSDVESRNNDGDYCTNCFDVCEPVSQEKFELALVKSKAEDAGEAQGDAVRNEK